MRGSVYMMQKKCKVLHGCAYVQPCRQPNVMPWAMRQLILIYSQRVRKRLPGAVIEVDEGL